MKNVPQILKFFKAFPVLIALSLSKTDIYFQARFNPWPKIKIWILICCLYSFPTEVVGRSW